MLGFIFALMTGNFTFMMLCEFSENVTSFEEMQKNRKNGGNIPKYGENRSCCENWEEIFGSGKRWYTWLLPIPAFNVSDDRYLIREDELTALL